MADASRPTGPEEGGYTPASPAKRVLAWIGVVYMVILVALTTYAIATGKVLGGLTGLMVSPALGGLSALLWLRRRERPDRRAGLALLALLAALLCGVNLFWGVLSLVLQLGG